VRVALRRAGVGLRSSIARGNLAGAWTAITVTIDRV
jgi:hypothetical protein